MRNFLCLSAALGASGAAVTPVEKVISLLAKLQAQVEEEGQKEAKAYDEYACFCKKQASDKLYSIENAKKTIGDLDADMLFYTGEMKELQTQIDAEDIKRIDTEGQMDKLVKSRKGTNDIYKDNKADLEGTISAVERATAAIKEQFAGMGDTQSLKTKLLAYKTVVDALTVVQFHPESEQFARIQAFLQSEGEKPGKAHGYTFHSQDILKLLNDLRVNCKAKLGEIEEAEFKSRAEHDTKMVEKKNVLAVAVQNLEDAREAHAEADTKHSAADARRTKTNQDKGDNQGFLDDLTKKCEAKAVDWDDRSNTRQAELTAMAGALDELRKGVTENFGANKKLVGLIGARRVSRHEPEPEMNVRALSDVATANEDDTEDFLEEDVQDDDLGFLQTNSVSPAHARKAIKYIEMRARQIRSPMLTTLAMKVNASGDPFVRIRQLINDLVAKLKQQQQDEDSDKKFCTEQMTKANTSKDGAQTDKMAELGNVQKETNTIALLTDTIKAKNAELVETLDTLKQMLDLRMTEKEDNDTTVEMAKSGHVAVSEAIQILSDFYTGAAGLIQEPGYVTRGMTHTKGSDASGQTVDEAAPETYEADYNGKQEESKGIIGMLEVIRADFARTRDTTTTEEDEAQKAYDLEKGRLDKHSDNLKTDIKQADSDRTTAEVNLDKAKDALKQAKKTLTAAQEALDSLKEQCVDSGVNAEERFARRKQEIDSLKSALDILRGVDVDLPVGFSRE